MSDLIWLSATQMRRIEDRRIISGIIFAIRNGLRWRDAPAEYGPPKTIWTADFIVTALRAGRASRPAGTR